MLSRKTYTVQEAISKLEHFCAYQERCHQEVRQKLVGMFMIPEAIDVIIVHLIAHNFLNEERFAKTFVSGKFKFKAWGRRRLIFELKKKGVSKTNINQALTAITDDDYIDYFNDLANIRVNLIKESNIYKKRKKFIDYFLYRGWEPHLVYDKAAELIK